MNISTKARKIFAGTMLIAVLPVLAACGGEEAGSAPPVEDPDGLTLGATIGCAFLSNGGDCSPSSGLSGETYGLSDGGFELPEFDPSLFAINYFDELEPNNSLGNAQPLPFPEFSDPVSIAAIQVDGAVNDQEDIVDTYIIMVPESRDYAWSLNECINDCEVQHHLSNTIAFFRLLDQDGNELFSSDYHVLGVNTATIRMDAGIVYYASVNAAATDGIDLPYRLRVGSEMQ